MTPRYPCRRVDRAAIVRQSPRGRQHRPAAAGIRIAAAAASQTVCASENTAVSVTWASSAPRSARRVAGGIVRILACVLALVGMGPGLHARGALADPAARVRFYDGNFECYAAPLALRLPDTYAQLLHLGPVRSSRDVRKQSERALTTTLRQIEFPGLRILVYLFSADPDRYQVARVQIGSAHWQLSALQVGTSINAVSLSTRWPALPRQGSWEIQGDSAHLLVRLVAGKIASVDYFCDSGTDEFRY